MSASTPVRQRPRGFQFRLGTLLAAMVWVGLVCLALRTPAPLWSGVIAVSTLLVVLTAILVAVYRPGRSRVFAIGFLVFSVGYLAFLALLSGTLGSGLRDDSTSMGGAFEWLFTGLHPPPNADFVTGIRYRRTYDQREFIEICNLALACLLGVVGGVVAQVLYATRREEAHERA